MASTHKSLRSSTASKRPTTSIADGQIALNTNAASPGLFFKDSTGATIIKVGPVHVGATAPNATPAAGGSSGNSTGEVWLDTSLTPVGVKIWDGSAWVNATPTGTTSVAGLLALATSAETQTGTDATKAVTSAGLQSKVSDSTSTTSSTTIASSTAVKSAYDLANAALPKAGGTVTGALNISETGSLVFEGATADDFETTLGVVDPTADRTINLPNVNGTVITTGDNGTVTSTMIANGTIVDADISGSAEIAVSKLADGAARQVLQTDAAGTGVEWTSNVALPGTASATSFSPTGSSVPTNGFYLPTTNTVALSTNGTQRVQFGTSEVVFNDDGNNYDFRIEGDTVSNLFFVDASAGAVGIGTSSVSNKLEVYSNTDNSAIAPNSDVSGLTITNASTATDAYTGLLLKSYGGTDSVYLRAIAKSNNAIDFEIGGQTSGQTSASPRLTIDSAGNVGIGTTSPATALHVSGSGTQKIRITGTGIANAALTLDASSSYVNYIEYGASASTPLAFYDLANSAERARIDTSGRLLVGTSSNSENVIAAFQGFQGSSTGQGIIAIKRGSTPSSGNTVAQIRFNGPGTDEECAYITASADATWGSADYPGRLSFSTTADGASSPTERMRITNGGAVKMSTDGTYYTTTPVHEMRQNNNNWVAYFTNKHASAPYGITVRHVAAAPNNTSNQFFLAEDTSGTKAEFRSNGGLANYSANNANLSDRNAKKDITPVADTWDCIKEWEIVNYRYKDQPDDADLNIGVVAQQVAESCPEVITVFQEATEDEPEKLGVKEQQMYWMAIKALQEAQVRIEALETEVAALKAQ